MTRVCIEHHLFGQLSHLAQQLPLSVTFPSVRRAHVCLNPLSLLPAVIPLTLQINNLTGVATGTLTVWRLPCHVCFVPPEKMGHAAHTLAAVTLFGTAPLTSRVQSNPLWSVDRARSTGNKHATLMRLIVTVELVGVWTGDLWLLPLFQGH